ncbi:hypothetical protein Back11_55230 [Paenibacillus baekrokdamisoli]|uniref:Uncharacterized protein n=1 Tax=Paenibacillus baekrokdamisoli TaxID=1712516 RepID=A0A3G9JJB2_9BACL|nr:hypothetical protein [Paenibacillus baekrokdamisoli]MBB3071840.1 hypothetical protein [Paenibacillus baekrokdamisoli]BBH24178.1 hypothetical protein Back11_55230 [Paenibacillus baekrokdamisoli]
MIAALMDQVVYGKETDCVYGQAAALWTNVPKIVLKRYIADQALSAEIDQHYRQKNMIRSIWYNKDLNVKRFISVTRYFFGHVSNYRRYYFDKEHASLNLQG